MVNWLGLVIPFAYVGILIGSLTTFSSLYRKRKAGTILPQISPLPNFSFNHLETNTLHPSLLRLPNTLVPTHLHRNIYLSLLHIEPAPNAEKPPQIPDSVLKAALLQRACEDIRRVLSIRNQKQPLSQLLQKGSVGDELWQRFLRAEKEVEAELRDVVEEANALQAGWGQTIFQSANEMVNNALIRDKVSAIQSKAASEREWWDKERASIQSQFMKELDEETAAAEAGAAKGGEGNNRVGSDEDAVLVEGGGPGSAAGKGAKKRKGKK